MPLVIADRVRETSTTVGTGTFTLAGVVPSYQSFAAIGNGNTVYYTIVNQSADEWEVGIGTYTASGTTLSRDTVLSSSNGGSLVNFGAGTKDVWGDYPAGKAVTTDTLAYPPVIGNTTPNAATFTTLSTGALTATGQTSLGANSSNNSTFVASAGTGVFPTITVDHISGASRITAANASGNSSIVVRASGGTGSIQFQTNGASFAEQFRVSNTASAVNYVQVTGAATGGNVTVSAQGSDSNIGITYQCKGAGSSVMKGDGGVFFQNNAGNNLFSVVNTSSSVNRLTVSGAATNFEPRLYAQGSDTNISMAFQSKGTGGISLSTGSIGTNLVNGTTVTAITRTGTGFSYTSFPSVAISAPTIAGGVQATAVVGSMVNTGSAVVSGGTGYTVNDVLTVVGGTNTGVAATLTVTSVSGGVVTAATPANFGQFTVLPTNPVSVTGGTGTGATFNLTFGIGSTPSFTITNAGSGYVEQPTVTFSGGGGSGAAAYATVGSGTTVRSLGSTMSFVTPGGEQFQVGDTFGGGVATNYWRAQGRASGQPLLSVNGTDVNINAVVTSKGTGFITFNTNAGAQEQLRVAHTASAVNFVQVTGAATGGRPTISAQGSDTNIPLDIQTKGTGHINFTPNRTNYVSVYGAGTGGAPQFIAAGGDTNIDLALTPKGTGLVRFGTYSSLASTTFSINGFIEIKDSAGNIRKLAVIV